MAFMKKDVNFGLFILIVAALILFAIFTTYYQDKFENLSTDYNSKIDEMNSLATHLQLEKAKLNQTSFELVKTVQKADDISDKYGSLKDEKEQLEEDIEQLTAELNRKTAKLAETEVQLSNVQTQLLATQAELEVIEDDLDDCESDLDDYENKYQACCDSG